VRWRRICGEKEKKRQESVNRKRHNRKHQNLEEACSHVSVVQKRETGEARFELQKKEEKHRARLANSNARRSAAKIQHATSTDSA